MSTVAPIFKRPRHIPAAAAHDDVPAPDPFQPEPSSILNRQTPSKHPARQQSPATFLPVEIELSHFRPLAFRVFTKKHNLTLKSDALAVLAEYIGRKCGSEWRVTGEPLLDEIARAWARAEDSNPLVDGEALVPVLKTLEVPHVARSTSFMLASSQPTPSLYESQSGDSIPLPTQLPGAIDPMHFFCLIDAFTQPKYAYNPTSKQFQLAAKPSILAAPKEKALIFRERYHVILQRLLRNELFMSYPTHVAPKHATAGKISSVKNLLGRRNQHFLLFGLLTRSPSGVLSLSDADGSVALDLSEAVSAGGLFAPGIFVLVDGKYTDNNVFRVHTIVLPPSERREASKKVFGHVDFLGARDANLRGGLVPVEREYEKFLVKAERVAGSIKMVFAGELNLDQPRTLRALKAMFEYYSADEDDPPMTFVLIGSFISTPFPGNGYSTTYKAHWDTLADLLSQFPRLTSIASFVFIPGPNDPWNTSPGCLPRRGVPDAFTNRVRRICKDVRFVSNPTRLGYFTQEICVFRSDVADALIRNRITVKDTPRQDPSLDEATLAARDLVKTILDQSHLTPFPLQVAPTYWSYDHTLRLYPLPTALILCDTSGWGPFKVTYEGCCVINIGGMLRVDKGDGRGRYTAGWWEWDCGTREGRELVVGMTEKSDKEDPAGAEKRERRKRGAPKAGRDVGPKIVRERGDRAGEIRMPIEEETAEMDSPIGDEAEEDVAEMESPIRDVPEEEMRSPIEDADMEETQIQGGRDESQMEDVAFGDEM